MNLHILPQGDCCQNVGAFVARQGMLQLRPDAQECGSGLLVSIVANLTVPDLDTLRPSAHLTRPLSLAVVCHSTIHPPPSSAVLAIPSTRPTVHTYYITSRARCRCLDELLIAVVVA